MGRPRVPAALNIFNGNPGRRKPRQPMPIKSTPVCPAWLHVYAKAHWKRTVADLRQLELVKQVDEGALALMCQSFAEARIALDDMKENGRVLVIPIQTPKGEIIGYDRKANPAVKHLHSAWDAYLRYAQQFGGTTISRTKLETTGGDEIDDLEALLGSG